MPLTLTPKRLLITFSAMAGSLIAMHCLVQIVRFSTGNERVYGLVYAFSLGADGNIPTYYSSLALLFCSLLLLFIAVVRHDAQKIRPGYWFGLAAIFLFLSIDEMLMVHEKLIEPMKALLNVSGIFNYAWVIPYGFGLLAFSAIYFRFLFRLPARTAIFFAIAGTIFVSGAIGLEMIGGWSKELHGTASITYVLIQSVEEIFEIVGIIIFIFALSDYIAEHVKDTSLTISSSPVTR